MDRDKDTSLPEAIEDILAALALQCRELCQCRNFDTMESPYTADIEIKITGANGVTATITTRDLGAPVTVRQVVHAS